MRVLLVILSINLLLSGCATTTYHTDFKPVKGSDHQIYYGQGWVVLHEQGVQYQVELAVRENKKPWDEITALVSVFNRSEQPVNVDLNNISFAQDGQPVALWSYDELEQKHRASAQSRRTAIALSALAQNLSASQPTTTSTYSSGSAYGTNGSSTYSGSSYSTTYNPAASAVAQAQIQANAKAGLSNVSADLAYQLSTLEGYIQKTTVIPGNSFLARFRSHRTRFERKPQSSYLFTVDLPGEMFEFRFVEETKSETSERKLF